MHIQLTVRQALHTNCLSLLYNAMQYGRCFITPNLLARLKYVCRRRWGQDIADVTVLWRLPNVEVLSLSINRISGLRSFGRCHALRELYLRKNEVASLEELRFGAPPQS
jgi:hypothetical protein